MTEAIDQKPSGAEKQPKCKTKRNDTFTERIQMKTDAKIMSWFEKSADHFNKANRIVHQGFHQFVLWKGGTQKAGGWIRYYQLWQELQGTATYQALPAQTAQQILWQVDAAWEGYFKALKAYKEDPAKFRARPAPPGCKEAGEPNLLLFTNQQCKLKCDAPSGKTYVQFPKRLAIPPVQVDPNRIGKVQQVRLLPRGHYAIVEIVYTKPKGPEAGSLPVHANRMAALDLGVRNLVCLVTNYGERPLVVQGGVVRAINQYYNKKRAFYQKCCSHQGIQGETRQLERLTRQRNNKIEDIFHKLSHALIAYCQSQHIGTLVVGYNEQWKQNVRLGRRNNQTFVNIPFYRLVEKLKYKATLAGITVVLTEESHTSKCSFLDKEPIEHHDTYLGQRGVYRSAEEGGHNKVSHGLFQTARGQVVNADVNGAYNILRKAFPEAVTADGIEGLGLVPIAVKFCQTDQDFTGLKHLAMNLNSSVHTFPKAVPADGSEATGPSPCGRGDSPGEDRTNETY